MLVDVTAPFVGRATERAAAAAAYARAAGGVGQVLLITGEAGIGKTRLVEEFSALVDPARLRVGESVPLIGTTLAYGPFVAALRDRAGWLPADDRADDRAGDPRAARRRLFERVRALLADLSAHAPLVLVLEDLHWADESSRALLTFLAVGLRAHPVLIVATLRDEDLAPDTRQWLAELANRPRVTRLRLVGLADAEVAALVTDLLPAGLGAERLAAVVTAAEGNPFYARELARADPHWPPASIAETVLARAAAVEPATREVIDQVSVAVGGMSHEMLAATVPLPEPALLAAARSAVALGLLTATADGYAFPHALIRQILYARLLPGERRLLHRRFADALAAVPGADPARLARHWHLAGRLDSAAGAALTAARRATAARGYPEADGLYALVVELSRWLPEWGAAVLEEAAQAASLAGDPERAAALVADALATAGEAEPADRARLLERLGRYRWESGDPRGAVEAAEQAVGLLDGHPPSALRARVLAALSTGRMLLGEAAEALPVAARAVEVARAADATAEHAHALATLGIIRAQRGDLDAGLDALRSSFDLARRAGEVTDVLRAATNHMYLLCTAGRFAEALDVARYGRRVARSMDAPPALTAVLDNNTAAVLVSTGRWGEAERLVAELIGESTPNITRYLYLLQLELAVARGEQCGVDRLVTLLAEPPDDPRLGGPVHACRAESALSVGDLATAAGEVLRGLAVLGDGDLAEEEMRLLADGARVAADLAVLVGPLRPPGIPDGWDAAVESRAERARNIVGHHRGEPVVAAFGALVAAEHARRGRIDDRATWRAVAEAWLGAEQPYREAYARLREAEAAVRAGRRQQATRALAACVSLARRLGAAPLLHLAQELAHRVRLTGQLDSPGHLVSVRARADLTERESQVLTLLANGESNRQIARTLFISNRTVAVHVSHILAKLSVRNRTEAATVGARIGLSAPSESHRPDEETHARLRLDPDVPD